MPTDSLKFCVPLSAPAFSRARTNSRDRRVGARSGLLVLLVLLAALPAAAQTKDEKKAEAQLRVVHGLVGDKDENPIPSSVVYLVNVKTKAVKTSFADEKGQYRFSGLDPNVDYEIHAEHGDLTSSTRTISSFDSRRDIEVNLKVTKTKKG
jgi:Carboxypeptidase regulatory-like domain